MPEGAVAVADAMGVTDAGIFGDILTARMVRRGVAGLVTDGVVRDAAGVLATGLPVWSAGVAAPASVSGLTFVGWQEPIGCGRVAVFPGDMVVADGDGAVVIPAALVEAVVKEGPEQEQFEAWVVGEVEKGAALPGLYPPNEATRARYRGGPKASMRRVAGQPVFFILSKTLGFVTLPSNLMILAGVTGVILMGRRLARAGARLAMASIVIIAVCGLSPLPNALMLPLEDRFPPWDSSHGPPDGIVVLGGAFENAVSSSRGDIALNEAAERMTKAVALARTYPAAKILFSGGSGEFFPEGPTEAKVARPLLESLGVAPGRLMVEDRSRNTAENAAFSKAIAAPKAGERWLLLTSAHHMPRSVGVFRRAGFDVEPYPVDWRTRGRRDLLRPFTVVSDGLKRTDTAAREWVGLLAYWLTGRSSELFPGPAK